jgi:hypothetical protein
MSTWILSKISWVTSKLLRLSAIIFYPFWILPKKGFKKEMDINHLNDLENHGIVRRSLRSRKNTFDKFGSVRKDALLGIDKPEKEVPGLSLNILGSKFKIWHLNYIPTKSAGKDWDGEETKLWWKYIKYATLKCRSVAIFFNLRDIHNITFPYSHHNEGKLKEIIRKNNPSLLVQNSAGKVFGASIIKHKPARLNYWHVEFHLLDIESRIEGGQTGITRQKAAKSVVWVTGAIEMALDDILLNSAFDKVNENWMNINRGHYKN